MTGDDASPVAMLFCHFQSGYAVVDVLKLPHYTAECFLAIAHAFTVAKSDRP